MPNEETTIKKILLIAFLFLAACNTSPVEIATGTETPHLETASSIMTPSLAITSTLASTVESDIETKLILQNSLEIYGPDFALSPDGKIIATSYRETISTFDITNGQLIAELHKPEAGLMGGGPIAFSPDGKSLAAEVRVEGSPGTESEFYLLDSSTLEILEKHPYVGRLGDLKYSFDGKFVAGTGEYGKIYVWDIKNKKVNKLDSDAYHLAFSPINPILASGELVGQGGSAVVLWDTNNFTSEGIFSLDIDPNSAYSGSATSVSFSPDGHTLAAVVNGQLRLWDMQLNQEMDSSLSISDTLTQALYASNGYLATINQSGELVIYDPDPESVIGFTILKGDGDPFHFEICFNMVFSPDGSQLLTGGCGYPIQIWKIP